MKICFSLMLLAPLLLSSCDLFKRGEYVPEYLRPDSPLDPPGTSEARKAMREKILKEGKYQADTEAPVKEGKVFLLERNPDRDESPSGKLVKAEKVKVIACEGTYYFVETPDKERGFVRESDLEDPVSLISTGGMFLLPPEASAGAAGVDLLGFPAEPLPLPGEGEAAASANQKVMLNNSGRTVVVVGKKTEKGDEFERRREQMLKASEDAAQQSAQGAAADEDVPLPEPAGNFQ